MLKSDGMKQISLSVHDFVDLILRKGDLDNRIFNTLSMEEGSRLHAWYQAKQDSSYLPEYYLEHEFSYGDYLLDMEGRADGVIVHDAHNVTIDEIKTTNTDIEEFYKAQKEWHLGQALVYAYIYLSDHKLDSIKVQLTYISQLDTTKLKQYLFIYTSDELEAYIQKLLERYCYYLKTIEEIKSGRQESIKDLAFPFPTLRKGQKELMDFVEETVKTSQVGFCEAKTGIGKTVSTLYPYIKALGEKNYEKIFYLTSKNSIKEVAYETIKMLNDGGAKLKAVIMTSKDKICLNDLKRHCNPDECLYAKNYYDKVNDLIMFALRGKDIFRMEDILEIARDNQICPFELQLDLLNYADIIVGDYNYLFDPTAKLMRFFENYAKNPFLLLIDEAHNLPTRVRDMFSSEISLEECQNVLSSLKSYRGKGVKPLIKDMESLIEFLKSQTIEESESSSPHELIKETGAVPDALTDIVMGFLLNGKKYMKGNKKINDAFLNFYYLMNGFKSLPEKDSRYAYYFTFDPHSLSCLSFSISCLDPRDLIKSAYGAFEAGVCFSATLSPKDYFIDLLGGDKDSLTLYLPSPFKRENCLVIVDPFVSTKFKDRDVTMGKIIDTIISAVSGKVGNYFIFFPSFEYMMKFKPVFAPLMNYDCYFQGSQMSEEDRNLFLSHFKRNPTKTTLGFIVLGGIFSEGIDLTEDRLIGAIIVSVGLPKLSFLEDKLVSYFGEEDQNIGYSYAYSYPGLNRVFQAAGRVIRGENDRGIIIYIDTRYAYQLYKTNLEEMYDTYVKEGSPSAIGRLVKAFWEKKE
jgi:DNA excision repair protein ERCC-2